LTPDEVLELLRRSDAYRTGHFRLSSGLHSDRYFQCALALQHPEVAERLGAAIAEFFRGKAAKVVVGPALGAVVLAHEVARALGARAIFTERDGGAMTLRRGFRLEEGEPALVVEDVVTTGGSVVEVIDVVRAAGATVAGVGAILQRGVPASLEVALRPLARVEAPAYAESDCPLCASGVPLEKPGSRPAASRECRRA